MLAERIPRTNLREQAPGPRSPTSVTPRANPPEGRLSTRTATGPDHASRAPAPPHLRVPKRRCAQASANRSALNGTARSSGTRADVPGEIDHDRRREHQEQAHSPEQADPRCHGNNKETGDHELQARQDDRRGANQHAGHPERPDSLSRPAAIQKLPDRSSSKHDCQSQPHDQQQDAHASAISPHRGSRRLSAVRF